MDVAVVVPWRDGCPHRRAAWDWVRARYAEHQPAWTVIEAPAPPGPWCKAAAINAAARQLHADVVVVADSDVWTDETPDAVSAVASGATWAIPHRNVFRLTPAATIALLSEQTHRLDTVERPYLGMQGGGIVVLRLATLRDIPPDERFIGWGQEDQSWAMALHMLTGPAWRGSADLLHLWHPPQPRLERNTGSQASHNLYRRYRRARSAPAAMRALIEEGRRDHHQPHQPGLHAGTPHADGHH